MQCLGQRVEAWGWALPVLAVGWPWGLRSEGRGGRTGPECTWLRFLAAGWGSGRGWRPHSMLHHCHLLTKLGPHVGRGKGRQSNWGGDLGRGARAGGWGTTGGLLGKFVRRGEGRHVRNISNPRTPTGSAAQGTAGVSGRTVRVRRAAYRSELLTSSCCS